MLVNQTKKERLAILIFYWILVFLVSAYLVWLTRNQELLLKGVGIFWSNYLGKVFGIYAFFLLSLQIFLGAYAKNLQKKYGSWVSGIHGIQGIIIFFAIFLHSLAFLIYQYYGTGKFDPFYIYTDFCFICDSKIELIISLGRISFVILAFTIYSAMTRRTDFMKKNWLYLHMLNYFTFILMSLHFYFMSPYITKYPSFYVFIAGGVLVSVSILAKLLGLAKRFRLR